VRAGAAAKPNTIQAPGPKANKSSGLLQGRTLRGLLKWGIVDLETAARVIRNISFLKVLLAFSKIRFPLSSAS
jgi:hypothetical protein